MISSGKTQTIKVHLRDIENRKYLERISNPEDVCLSQITEISKNGYLGAFSLLLYKNWEYEMPTNSLAFKV